MRQPKRLADHPSRARHGCTGIILLLVVAGCALAFAAALVVTREQARIQASGIRLADADPDLGLSRRLFLQYRLAQQANLLRSPAGTSKDLSFLIPAGAAAETVADELVAAGLLVERDLFLDYLRFYGLDGRLQTGRFTLNGDLNIPQLAEAISEGVGRDITVSFLNGLRLEEMAEVLRVTAPAKIDHAEFLAFARREKHLDLSDYSFLNSLSADMTLEGFLFPGTYTVPATADAAYLINEMLRNFDRQVSPAMRQAYGAQNLSLPQAVILASIVERETPVDEERVRIASVYTNRLRNDMPLQADPTVQYAIGYQDDKRNWWKAPLSLADLKTVHPYNTYLIPGLPPGPIANPGLASLQAIAEPEESDFLFFVLDCDSNPPGRHVFSRTYEEHLGHVQRCS